MSTNIEYDDAYVIEGNYKSINYTKLNRKNI